MSNNKLIEVRNIEYLPALQSLDLSSNQINRVYPGPLRNLRSLKLSNNRLLAFDVDGFPSLRLLYLDKNCLSTIDGLDKCHHLETLSVREQAPLQVDDGAASYFDIDLNALKDIRKLFLSSNRLAERVLSPSRPLLTLQLLDAASCALPSLPSHFGTTFPNLRVLNLNFNALSSVEALAGMNGLSRLTLVGNRIGKLRKFCQVLNRLGRTGTSGPSSVKTVDLRGNPLTVGFYPPPISGSGRGGGNNKPLESNPDAERGVQSEQRSTALASFGHCVDIAGPEDLFDCDKIEGWNDMEIDDPYTVPPADMEADQKYLSSLDESTKLRRMAVELMLYTGTGGAIQVLDGLALRSVLERGGTDVDRVWGKLEELGVLKKSQSLRHD
jgi:protein NUD1